MRNHGVDPRPDTVCSWLAQRAMRVLLRQENSRRRDQIAGNRIPPLRYIESELKDQPESEELGQKRGVHLHGDIAVNFERIDNRYLETTGGVVNWRRCMQNQTRLVLPATSNAASAPVSKKLLRLK